MEDASLWRMRRHGRCRRRCCAMAPTPLPLTDTTSLTADHLHRPPPPPPASTTKPPPAPPDHRRLAPVEARLCGTAVSLRWSEMGNSCSSNTAADRWGPVTRRGQEMDKNTRVHHGGSRSRIADDDARSDGPRAADANVVFSQLRQAEFPPNIRVGWVPASLGFPTVADSNDFIFATSLFNSISHSFQLEKSNRDLV
jgi:hypothetical protein